MPSYFSVIQRKVLEPNQWRSLAELEAALIAFGEQYSAIARPFECASPGSISTACWLP